MSKVYTRAEIEAMQDDVIKQAKANNHSMGKWRVSQYGENWTCYVYCQNCYDGAIIDTVGDPVIMGRVIKHNCDPSRIPF